MTQPPHVQHEIEGMNLHLASSGEAWATRLRPPHPPHVARAAGAVLTATSSLRQGYMVAYLLDDAGLLVGRCPARTERHTCYLIADHPGDVHLDLSSGWPHPFSPPPANEWANKLATPVDPAQDALDALKRLEAR